MRLIETILYILFALSIMAPVYTYAIYPFVLKLFKKKKYVSDYSYKSYVSVVIFSEGSDTEEKIKNLEASGYPVNMIDISVVHTISELNECVPDAKGEFILFTDAETELDAKAVSNLIARFADNRIGCVCGRLRKKPHKDGKSTDSMFWRYENKVKQLESGIGRLSGANSAIYAVRKNILPTIKENVINLDFYISTYVLQAGWDVVMAEDAIAYEAPEKADCLNFEKHVHDGAGYYQALGLFWRMLFPRKGSFIYVSHRVMKWFVPFNMITILLLNIIMAFYSIWFAVVLICLLLFYLLIWMLYKLCKTTDMRTNKFLSIVWYFFALNASWLLGLLFFIIRRTKQ